MFKKLKEKYKEKIRRFDELYQSGLLEMQNDIMNSEGKSKLFCKKCKNRIPIVKLCYSARKVDVGEKYKVKCKCGHININIKGKD